MGHTYPGATVPFGSVQLSPDTDQQPHNIAGKYNKDAYKYCAGYQYDDKSIIGFSHTHFSGTGHSDLGDFLIMPTVGELQLEPGAKNDPGSGFRSAFSHANEKAEPTYYKVLLEDDNIQAEMTATTRVGFHQYTFPKSDNAHIILDLMHGIYNYDDKNVWTFVRVENDHTVVGYRQTNGWARTRTVYFAMEFSKPFVSYGFKNFGREKITEVSGESLTKRRISPRWPESKFEPISISGRKRTKRFGQIRAFARVNFRCNEEPASRDTALGFRTRKTRRPGRMEPRARENSSHDTGRRRDGKFLHCFVSHILVANRLHGC